MKIDKLSEKLQQCPRNKVGDPAFTAFTALHTYDQGEVCVTDVFTPDEVTELVNRALYQLEYQQRSHAKYQRQRRELEQPVREIFKQLYPKESFAKATIEQYKECVAKLKEVTNSQ